MRRFVVAAFLLCTGMAGTVFAQVNSAIGGTVEDPSGALIPGVTITATNTQTSLASTTLTNESGAYNFPALIAGTYRVSASLPGFRSQTFNDVPLSAGVPVRLNFKLEVGPVTTDVEVSIAADALLAQSSASIGEVLTDDRVTSLPLVSNNVLDLVRILPGFRESPGGNAFDTFAGLPAETLNTTRDGVSVTDGRFANGLFSTTNINPDLVGEVRLILTPVDAELGRGNAQVQITTRSGTNRFAGSAVWNVQNSALDPNTWLNNHTIDPVTGKTAQRNWSNNHQYSLAYGGPIIKGKTFFYALWDQQIHKERVLVDGTVLTDTARLGIFRYFDGWNPQRFGVANTPTPTGSPARVYTAVDALGNPVAPAVNANGTPYSGAGLRCFSVFGTQRLDGSGNMVPFGPGDCPGGTIVLPAGSAAAWDNNRPAFDTTGYIWNALLQNMPRANYFGHPVSGIALDGLNTAAVRWVRSRGGNDDGNTTTGLGDHWARKQINIKLDHNFSQRHKLSGSYTLEQNFADSSQSGWPNGYGGDIVRKPHVVSTNFTSTLGPSLVNEARFGMRYNKTDGRGAFENDNRDALSPVINYFQGGPDPGITRAAGTNYPVLVGASGVGSTLFANAYNFNSANGGLFTLASSHNGNRSILYTFADSVSWTKGKHAFKFGGEFRPTTSRGYSNVPNLPTPRVYTGAGGTISPVASGGSATIAGALTSVRNNAASLLYMLAGSINQVEMVYWMDSYQDVQDQKWQSILTRPDIFRTVIINEGAGFVKDDWKITNNLTLNLGVRWEYYGSPYISEGLTGTPRDLGIGVFGVGRNPSGSVWDNWLLAGFNPVFLSGYGTAPAAGSALQCSQGVAQANLPNSSCNSDYLTQIDFIGPNSPNPDRFAIPSDRNNFGPAIGFAYQVPWLSRTTVRGGYQMTFGSAGRNTSTILGGTQQVVGSIPGSVSNVTGAGTLTSQFPNQYLDLTSISTIVPLQPTNPVFPGGTFPLYSRAPTLYGYAPDFATPYAQNFNLSVTTSVRPNVTLDVRYIGTQAKKQQSDINVNTNNIYFNQELYDALDSARQGGDPLLLTQMLAGLNLGTGVIGTATTGAAALRASTVFNQGLIDGNYLGVANSLLTGNSTTWTGFTSNTSLGVTPAGRLIRNGCDRIATTGQTTFNGIPLRCFPENYLNPNPQLGTTNAYYRTNSGSSNYHSMQAQVTLRPTHGFSVQSTYTWSKTLRLYGADTSNPLDRRADYSRPFSSVTHDWRTNGTIELPVGPGKLLLGNSSGWLARALERWQMGVILNLSGGRPISISALTGLNYAANGTTSPNVVPDVVGPFDVRKADLYWDGANNRGSLFGESNPFVVVPDPQCNTASGFPSNLSCNLNAVARIVPASTPGAIDLGNGQFGQIVLQNPQPGTQGNLGQTTFEMPGVIRFDANLGKSFRITETKALQIRFDATNVLNHPNPNPAAPTISINNDDFGYLTNPKTGNRTFQGQLRLTF